MKTTSHFIGIELQAQLFSDIFVSVNSYLVKNNIADSILFQNPLSPHITLYYLEKEISDMDTANIKKSIQQLDVNQDITLSGYDYFFRGEGKRFVLYFTSKTDLPLEEYRNQLHAQYDRTYVEDNAFSFSPHITFLKIQDSDVFEKHRENIETILTSELKKIGGTNVNTGEVFLYGVNSTFKEEIQIKM